MLAPYKSTKGLGLRGPDLKKNIILSNGAIIPVGNVIDYKYPETEDPMERVSLAYNEYIVYDTSQIRMRYLIQVSLLL